MSIDSNNQSRMIEYPLEKFILTLKNIISNRALQLQFIEKRIDYSSTTFLKEGDETLKQLLRDELNTLSNMAREIFLEAAYDKLNITKHYSRNAVNVKFTYLLRQNQMRSPRGIISPEILASLVGAYNIIRYLS